ncbi:proton-conducting transporter transmembrane domain-containing protein [Blastococcus sp. PRF04-17]|uniref:proton-conducting transporter transmembrane domain-containing protein n=1 Tax=Blastococcus sp. PRF04-17 TaxID=2933797 RepID=UPI001FF48207|nr:proton-conducting transporter membrane subunit [Blastococcus sp. PRF04-17]UOX99960.1 monovalent cation/H+ antiporter subunit D family protein [Blastococcus sp. PRF04-17]
MSATLLVVPVAAPLAAAGALVLAARRAPGGFSLLMRTVGWGATSLVLVVAVVLLAAALDGGIATLRLGGWPPGIAIVLVADVLSAVLLAVTSALVLASLAFAAATGEDEGYFVPLALVLSTGVYGALLTGDLFNLFVFVEVMLVPSYVLLVAAGGARRLAAGRRYLAVNLLASTLFLAGVGLLYGVTGTVNLGELAGAASVPAVGVAGAVLMVALAVKAAVVPLHSWLPGSYAAAGPAVVVLFSGLLTKVGVYALVRVYSVVFDGDQRWLWLIMAAGVTTMVVGVLGAVGEGSMRSVLTFHMVSQIGYMVVGLALFTTAGLAAGIFFLVQYVLVKAALLMCAGAVEVGYGTDELHRLRGLGRREPALAVAFGISALALVGVPPLSGFVAKLYLLDAVLHEAHYVAAAAIAGVSFLTLTSMLKVWNAVFTQPAPGPGGPGAAAAAGAEEPARHGAHVAVAAPAGPRTGVRPVLVAPAVVLAALAVVLGIWAEPLLTVAEEAARGLVDTTAYVTAVTSP